VDVVAWVDRAGAAASVVFLPWAFVPLLRVNRIIAGLSNSGPTVPRSRKWGREGAVSKLPISYPSIKLTLKCGVS